MPLRSQVHVLGLKGRSQTATAVTRLSDKRSLNAGKREPIFRLTLRSTELTDRQIQSAQPAGISVFDFIWLEQFFIACCCVVAESLARSFETQSFIIWS